MTSSARKLALVVMLAAMLIAPASAHAALTAKQELGKALFFDANLSEPNGQSCAACHAPAAGYADPDTTHPTSAGVMSGLFGNRNAPTAAYASLIPVFTVSTGGCGMGGMQSSVYRGGQFWDGRAATLVEQAKGPFLNPLEMHNASKDSVVADVRASQYADLFKQVYGQAALDDTESAYDHIADAIAAFEASAEVNRFSSRYDGYLAGSVKLTSQESLGMSLFNGRGGCFRCHGTCGMGGRRSGMGGTSTAARALSDFTYHNVGAPRNDANPFYSLPYQYNPAGSSWIDEGLGGVLRERGVSGWQQQLGKHRVQTLRNVAVTAPYMHNGVFTSLKSVVHFYNKRSAFGSPEVSANVTSMVGNLGLTSSEEDAIVAFLETLTDR